MLWFACVNLLVGSREIDSPRHDESPAQPQNDGGFDEPILGSVLTAQMGDDK